MAIKALNPFAPFWWSPASEEGAPKPTRFKIRGLDGNEQAYVHAELLRDPDTGWFELSPRGVELALSYALLDWENFENDKGPVAFARGNFGLIDILTRRQIAYQIVVNTYVQAEEKKT